MQKSTNTCRTSRGNSPQVKKIPFVLFRLFVLVVVLFADNLSFAGSNVLKIDSVQVFPSQTVTLNISVNNQDPFISFQVDIMLPVNFSYISGSAALNPARKVDHVFSISTLPGNVLRVLAYSMSNQLFIGNSGSVLSLKLASPASAGSHPLPTANALIGSPDAANILTAVVNGAINLMGPLIVAVSASPQNACAGLPVQLNSTINGGGWNPSLIWISTPSGFSSTNPSPIDYPQQTTQYGVIVNDGYQIASDIVIVSVSQPPGANAGEDRWVCKGSNVYLSGLATNYISLQWQGGNGSFSHPTSLITTYTPSASDLMAGSVLLSLTATGASVCAPATDWVVISFVSPPLPNAGNDLFVHTGNAIQINGASAQNYGSVVWSTAGDGQFSNPNILNPDYTPGFMDVSFGSVTLVLTATAIAPCNNVSDPLILHILKQGDNVMALEAGTAYLNDTVTISLSIKNKHAFSAFACMINLPPQLTYIEGSAALSERKADHLPAASATGNTLFFQAESPTNSLFSGNQGAVMRFRLLTGASAGQFQMTIPNASVLEPFGANILTDLVNTHVTVLISGLIRPAATSLLWVDLVRHPESGALVLKLNLAKATKVQTEIYDFTGRCLFRSDALQYAVGQHFVDVVHLTSRIANSSHEILLLRVLTVDELPVSRTFKLSGRAY